MGINHLSKLREFMEENNGEAFSRTKLMSIVGCNWKIIKENLRYLLEIEKVVIRFEKEGVEFYQWKGGRLK